MMKLVIVIFILKLLNVSLATPLAPAIEQPSDKSCYDDDVNWCKDLTKEADCCSETVKTRCPDLCEIDSGNKYTKIEDKFCNNQYNSYNSVIEAQVACNLDHLCQAVYDQGCDESPGDVILCQKGSHYYYDSTSCIYEKAKAKDAKAKTEDTKDKTEDTKPKA